MDPYNVVLLTNEGERCAFGIANEKFSTSRSIAVWFGTSELGQHRHRFNMKGHAWDGGSPYNGGLLVTRDAFRAIDCFCMLLRLLKGETLSLGQVDPITGEAPAIRFKGVNPQ
jgi:hypothetical protein